jgi:hypothetical protein
MSFFERCETWADYYQQFRRAPEFKLLTEFFPK